MQSWLRLMMAVGRLARHDFCLHLHSMSMACFRQAESMLISWQYCTITNCHSCAAVWAAMAQSGQQWHCHSVPLFGDREKEK